MRNSRPSDDYREVAHRWVTLDAAARLLEESKTAVLAQRCTKLGAMPVARAEQLVKSSDEWRDYLKKMISSRTEANKARIEMKYYEMRFSEWQSDAANERTQTRLSA